MKKILSLFTIIVLTLSCKTYIISPENFKKQIIESDANNLKEVKVNNPISPFSQITYRANSLKYLNVYDDKGSLSFMQNSPSIEMRVTLKNGTRKLFYLDTVTLENDTLKGEKSRILGLRSKVPFNDIVKIEVQDGGKNYHYAPPTREAVILENSNKVFENRGEELERFTIQIDTFSIDVHKFNHIYYASCKIEKRHSELSFLYHLNNNLPELITTREISPYENDIWWINNFYIENDVVFFVKSFCLPKKGSETPKIKKYRDYKSNLNLNAAALQKFSFEIYDKIKNHH